MNTKKRERAMPPVTIADCRVDTFTVGGHGGAGKDTSNTGVRITHLASGAVGECRETRSQAKNKEIAWVRMAMSNEFRVWHKRTLAELRTGKTIEQHVDEEMNKSNLKVEGRDENGKWVPIE